MYRLFWNVFGYAFCALALAGGASAQNVDGRWGIGMYAGANLWVNDLNQTKIGPGGMIALRYGLTPSFSLGLIGGMEEVKSGQSPALPDHPYTYLKLNAFPIALTAYLHLSPSSSVSPYFRLGGGLIFYNRKTADNAPAPDADLHSSHYIPFGVGVEAFTSSHFALVADIGGANFDEAIDLRSNSSPDGIVSAKLGVTWFPARSDGDDDDADGLTNGQERRLGSNPNDADTDGDGLSDGEEIKRYHTNPLRADTDGDGLKDGDEVMKYKTDPAKYDTDGDGLSDGAEILKYLTDPLRPDTDGDGLSDGDEVLKYKTDPLKVDTDGDGLSDWDEVKTYHTDPTNSDSDGDGLMDGEEVTRYHTDPLKADTDGGGLIDGAEIIRGTNPLDPKDDVLKETILLERGKTVVLQGVNFGSNSATLTRESEEMLERAYTALLANPTVKVEIGGYTDNVGSRAANERLSQRRADAVKVWLVTKGIAASRLSVKGYGLRDPIESNSTPDGRSRNRRIEFHVK